MTKAKKAEKAPPKADESVVSKAVVRASKCLQMTNTELAKVIGVSTPQLSKISNQKTTLSCEKKEFELAVYFVRLYRSLDAITGGDDNSASKWLRAKNKAFNDTPINRIKTIGGLLDVIAYLDSRRAVV